MHTLHWIAVQADGIDKEDELYNAMQSVETLLDENIVNNWYDWFVVGGGRWNMDPNDDSIMSGYEAKTNMIISSKYDGIEAIQERIAKCIDLRIAEFNLYRKNFVENGIDLNKALDKYDGNTDFSFDLYDLGKMIDMLQGNWDFNSYFFDGENLTTNPKYMLDKLASDDVDWFLVPVDFHF